MAHPTDNLVRVFTAPMGVRAVAPIPEPDGTEDTAPGGSTLYGHFAVFNAWTEINSWMEGRFIERIAPGAFAATFASRANQIRVLYDHGNDPTIGNKPLGTPLVLREDTTGAYYEVELFSADYVEELKPALAAGQMGASFRFRVMAEEWVTPSESTSWNPEKLDERTITAVELYEFGPVTFPAYAEATAGLRSATDHFAERLLHDPVALARFIERVGPNVASKVLTTVAADGPAEIANKAADGPEKAPRGRLVTSVRTHLLSLKGA